METRIVDTKLNELQGHMNRLHSTIEQDKKTIHSLRDDTARLKQRLADDLTKGAKKNPDIGTPSSVLEKIKNDYNKKIEAKIQELEQKQKRVDDMEKHLNEAEDIYKELKKQSQALHEVEQKAKTWLDRASRLTEKTSIA